jgi:hypothetical protein
MKDTLRYLLRNYPASEVLMAIAEILAETPKTSVNTLTCTNTLSNALSGKLYRQKPRPDSGILRLSERFRHENGIDY